VKHRLLGLVIDNGHERLILGYIVYVSRETLLAQDGYLEAGLSLMMCVELRCRIGS
jgi:hypothetical protein